MAIKYYLGGPGAGKSVFAMKEDIIESFFVGRKVYTNINGVEERLLNTSVYLQKYHKKHKTTRINEIKATLKEIYEEIKNLEDEEQDILDEKLTEAQSKLDLIEFLENADYTVEYLKSKLVFLKNENEEFTSITDRVINGEVVQVLMNFLDEDGELKEEYRNAIFVIDEGKKFFSKDMVKKFPEKMMYNYQIFIGEHRHFGFDIIFIDQEFWKIIDDLIKYRVQTVYSLEDTNRVGIKGGYYCRIYSLSDPSQSTYSKAFIYSRTMRGKYDVAIFKCYRSVRAGANSRNSFDKKVLPFYNNIKFIAGGFILSIVIVVMAFTGVLSSVSGDPSKKVSSSKKPNNLNNVQKIPDSKRSNTDTKPVELVEKIDYYSRTKHPIFELIKKNYGYCNGYISNGDFDFNYKTKFNSVSKKYSKSFSKKYLNSDDYAIYTDQVHYLVVRDSNDEILFETDTQQLAEYYHLEIQILDECYYRIKFGSETLTIYPFNPPADDKAVSASIL